MSLSSQRRVLHQRFDWRDPSVGIAVLLVTAVVAGGGGVNAPFGNLAVQLVAIGLLALHGGRVAAAVRTGPRALVVLVAATCLVPLAQLVPLPPVLWAAFPGRDIAVQSYTLAGGLGWAPLSLDPARTLVAFLSLLPPLAIVVLGLECAPHGLIRLQRVVIAAGVAAALFGTTHLLNAGWGDLYSGQRPMPDVLVATFADRNAAALFLVACLTFLAGLPAPPRDSTALIVRISGAAFLTVCVVLTGSRTGMALLVLPAGLLGWRFLSAKKGWTGRLLLPALGLMALAAAGAAGVALSGRGQESLARYADAGDGMRAEMREDALFAARRYWPAGAGMGTFDEVFQIDESLEYVSPRRAGRAHMDYLELVIEAGIFGLLLVVGWVVWWAAMAWRAVRRPDAWPARAAALILAGLALQSIVLFPLRNEAMMCLAAVAIVLLARSPQAAPRAERVP